MHSASLERWVMQQCKEIGFGKGGKGGTFIGRPALKEELIRCYPKHEDRIRQLVNNIKLESLRPPIAPMSQPTAKPCERGKAEKALQSSKKSPPLKSAVDPKKPSISPPRLQQEDVVKSTGSDAGTQDSAARFASSTENSEKSTSPISEFSKTEKELAVHGTVARAFPNSKICELKKYLDEVDDFESWLQDEGEDAISPMDLQLGLLHHDFASEEGGVDLLPSGLRNAVLFSGDVLGPASQDNLPQYGLLGSPASTSSTAIPDPRMFLNTNIPFSAFVCGVQGSGKSHTTACMIENFLIPSPVLGVLQKPLTALVFNFAEYASISSFRPCELAFLASPAQRAPTHLHAKRVKVMVSPSNYLSLKALYTQIPGVTVQPFVLRPEDLSISIMLTLMSVDQTQAAPLYMGTVTKVLRNMASETAQAFNYLDFRRRLNEAGLDRKQEEFLNQRLDLLESFLDLEGSIERPSFAAGEITIIDLSCPFVDSSTACVLFKIGMGLYLESDSTTGKVIVLDEAHKYMTDTPASKALTESLKGVIRQQRHYGARVIISTQEPSISPKLIDLCSITIMHRFSSPEWLDVLQKHIILSEEGANRDNKVGLLKEIMRLETGEALVFAPSAILGTRDDAGAWERGADKLLKMRMRKRVTWDGGRSVVCV